MPTVLRILCSVILISLSVNTKVSAQSLGADTTIVLKAIAGLQFDQPRIVVKPGKRLQIILQNYDDMAHNLVVTRPNSRLRVVEAALRMGADGAAKHYIPEMQEVLAHTRTVEPDVADTLVFAPTEGAYPFVCTYPGHGAFMYGVLYATREPKKLPAPEVDPNLPKRNVDQANHAHHAMPSGHPYALKLPAVYRTFMPDAGPAAIAVGLPGDLSYCWDAGTCQLRYAWTGGFVDNADQWDGKGNKLTKIVGDIFYQNPMGSKPEGFPIRLAKGASAVRYRGYQLENRYPVFMYSVGPVVVNERITEKKDQRGLVRRFTLPVNAGPLTFRADEQPGVKYQATINNKPAAFRNGILTIPANTKQFTVTMLVP